MPDCLACGADGDLARAPDCCAGTMSRQLADSCTVLIKNLKLGDAERIKDFACRKVMAKFAFALPLCPRSPARTAL